jgi:ATP-dependent Zn protease
MEETTAFHEAGHAFVAIMVGARVVSITIDPDNNDLPDRYGDTQIAWDRSQFSDREFAEKFALVSLAGPVAEMILTGDAWHPALLPEWSGDWQQAMQSARGLCKSKRECVALLERMAIESHQVLSRDDVWPFIGAIVDELVAHETLEGEQVHEIVDEWMRLNQ